MQLGLWLSKHLADREAVERVFALCQAQDIPVAGVTVTPCPRFQTAAEREAFLCRAAEAIMRGEALPAEDVARHLSRDARAGNVLRRYVGLRASLALHLNNAKAREGQGCFFLGDDIAVCPLSDEGAVDALPPPGVWTELMTGETVSGAFRRLRSASAMPLLIRENALLAVRVDGTSMLPDGQNRLTIHWFQPGASADLALPGLGRFHAQSANNVFSLTAETAGPCRFVTHQDGVETCRD